MPQNQETATKTPKTPQEEAISESQPAKTTSGATEQSDTQSEKPREDSEPETRLAESDEPIYNQAYFDSLIASGKHRTVEQVEGVPIVTGESGPIFIGRPYVGLNSDPVTEITGVGSVRFLGRCGTSRCQVYVEIEEVTE